MNIALLILTGPHHSQGSRTALHFARAAVDAGHRIPHVFFFGEGTYNSASHGVSPSDESLLGEEWQAFAASHGIELDACISSAMKRGLLDEGEAKRYQKDARTLADGFVLAGLGQLATASLNCDRVVTF